MCTHTYTIPVASVPYSELYYEFVNSLYHSLPLRTHKTSGGRNEVPLELPSERERRTSGLPQDNGSC